MVWFVSRKKNGKRFLYSVGGWLPVILFGVVLAIPFVLRLVRVLRTAFD